MATVWLQQGSDGLVLDPYKLLLIKLEGDVSDDETEGIYQGGAASYAYLRLQFEDIQPAERVAIVLALLRYCELDTLAILMILQGWLG